MVSWRLYRSEVMDGDEKNAFQQQKQLILCSSASVSKFLADAGNVLWCQGGGGGGGTVTCTNK